MCADSIKAESYFAGTKRTFPDKVAKPNRIRLEGEETKISDFFLAECCQNLQSTNRTEKNKVKHKIDKQ